MGPFFKHPNPALTIPKIFGRAMGPFSLLKAKGQQK